MIRTIDLRSEPARPSFSSLNLTEELATCLERFLDGTADEGTMTRARHAVDAWHELPADQPHHAVRAG